MSIYPFSFAFLFFASRKDKNAENNPESYTELHASAAYQCPMDCENGKTYDEARSCPVCKMDLKASNQGDATTCAVHKDGKCSCEGDASVIIAQRMASLLSGIC